MMIDLVRSLSRGLRVRWPVMSAFSLAGLGVLVGTLYAGAPASLVTPVAGLDATVAPVPTSSGVAVGPESAAELDLAELAARVQRVTDAWGGAQRYYDQAVAPIERVLLRYRNDADLARRIAVALVREANHVGLEPRLLLAVLLVENPWLDPEIRSPVGAIGLMQVMPVHRGAWRDCDHDLEDIDANICYGARIFAHYFRASGGDIERALLRYNGCVRGTNTPDCHRYPYHVFARAGRASVLAWLDASPGAGAR